MADLSGLLVVSIEHAVAAPYASSRLADAGARVIKVERPEGDFARDYDALVQGQSAYFIWLNRGKESIALDLKEGSDRALLDAMIAEADVVIQNLGPGAIERLGYAPERLLRENPRCIVCNISGYGQEGPLRDQKAYDLLIQAESGLAAINGTPEGPARVGVSVCDIAAGMTAYQAILEALLGRQSNGKGRIVDVSLFHAMSDWMNVPYLQYRYGNFAPQRLGLKHPSIAPYGVFSCADGKSLLLSIQNEREWEALCAAVFDRPDMARAPGYASNRERIANRDAVDAFCAEHISTMDRPDAMERMVKAKIACGRLSDLDDVVAHPQNRKISVSTEVGEIELLSPGANTRGEARAYGSVPALDQHRAALRNEFGDRPRAASIR
jgi:crotonobetainyl-CoA:carnitine CoA-transferase CaiB-like acyl-CoA transferase